MSNKSIISKGTSSREETEHSLYVIDLLLESLLAREEMAIRDSSGAELILAADSVRSRSALIECLVNMRMISLDWLESISDD